MTTTKSLKIEYIGCYRERPATRPSGLGAAIFKFELGAPPYRSREAYFTREVKDVAHTAALLLREAIELPENLAEVCAEALATADWYLPRRSDQEANWFLVSFE